MITLIRWVLLKQKEIKLKLTLFSILEQGIEEIFGNKDKFIHDLAEAIRQGDSQTSN